MVTKPSGNMGVQFSGIADKKMEAIFFLGFKGSHSTGIHRDFVLIHDEPHFGTLFFKAGWGSPKQ